MATTTKKQEGAEDLLGSMSEEDTSDNVEKRDEDLLSDMDGSGSEAWVPEKPGDGIQGYVVRMDDKLPDQYKDDETVPVVTIQVRNTSGIADGETRRIMAYATVLRNEVRDAELKHGDFVAVKYIEDRPRKNAKPGEKPVKIYVVSSRKKAPPF